MSLLLINGSVATATATAATATATTVTAVATADTAYAAAGTTRTIGYVVTVTAATGQIEGGNLSMSGYQRSQSRAYGPMQSGIRAFLL